MRGSLLEKLLPDEEFSSSCSKIERVSVLCPHTCNRNYNKTAYLKKKTNLMEQNPNTLFVTFSLFTYPCLFL